MMQKSIFVFAIVIIISHIASAQAAKSIYFELGGPGFDSFNFDTRFSAQEAGIGGRIGIGYLAVDNAGGIFVPIAFNYLLGKNSKNYFEIGAGVTPVIRTSVYSAHTKISATFSHLNFGYRLQPPDKGFTFRAFISPIFGIDLFIPYFGGISLGYKF